MNIKTLTLITAFIFAFAMSPAHAEGDPVVGTWVVNNAKSKLDPPPNNVSGSATAKIEKMGDGYKGFSEYKHNGKCKYKKIETTIVSPFGNDFDGKYVPHSGLVLPIP